MSATPTDPAAPVVHPEPGDRAEWSFATMDQYLLPKARQDAWDAVREQAGEEWLAANFQMVDAALWNAAPAIVAAAVAAVRADRDCLAGQVAAIRALCDEWDAEAQETWTSYSEVNAQGYSRIAHGIRNDAQVLDAKVTALRAALVASSPTTP